MTGTSASLNDRSDNGSSEGNSVKQLTDTSIPPGLHDGGWGLGHRTMVFFPQLKTEQEERDEPDWGGPNICVENNSKCALRIVVYDVTDEYNAERERQAEIAEREQLAALKAKYGD